MLIFYGGDHIIYGVLINIIIAIDTQVLRNLPLRLFHPLTLTDTQNFIILIVVYSAAIQGLNCRYAVICKHKGRSIMSHPRIVVLISLAILLVVSIGCSSGENNPVMPAAEISAKSVTEQVPPANQFLAGYYDVYFDCSTKTFEIVENRTAAFTLNIVPFLNMMMSPRFGITFGSILVHTDDPTFLGVDVEFQIHHPFPGIDQYNAYDLMGVVIGEGHEMLEYGSLYVGEHGTDLWMNNADGFTRWFNPTDFTTEMIFGYVPGGFQNLAGNAHLNPYKYYSRGLEPEDELWDFLTGPENYDGVFQSADGRMMELEFPLPPDGIGLMFGYAVVVAWEEQGATGPYTPYHRPGSNRVVGIPDPGRLVQRG